MEISKILLFLFSSIIVSVFLLSSVHASGIGTSSVSLTQSSVNISQGSSASIGFTITLVSGTPWGTSLTESPSSSYITFSPSASNQDPTYSGTLAINVAKNTPVGKYIFNISSVGDDPSASPIQFTVYVAKAANSTNTTSVIAPSHQLTSKPTNYFEYIGTIFIILIAVLLGLEFSLKRKFIKAAKYTMLASIVLSLAAAAYLLIYDTLLRASGMLHYDILAVFFVLTIILAYLVYGNKKTERKAELILGSLSALFVLAMFLDAVLGLPLTNVSGSLSYGFNYLFGFGAAGTSSLYGISMAFSLLLLSVTATAILSLFSYFIHGKN